MIKRYISLSLLIIYLFCAGTFFHVQAMGVSDVVEMEWDCLMHHAIDSTSLPINNGCYEKCLGIYDDFFWGDIVEKTSPVIYLCLVDRANLSVQAVSLKNSTFYKTMLDRWWVNLATPQHYTKAIRKIE